MRIAVSRFTLFIPKCVKYHQGNTTVLKPAGMYEDLKEYLNWYDTRRDVKFAKGAPIIGLVLQRSHLVTGDEGHYSGVVSELEARGAKASNPQFKGEKGFSPCLLISQIFKLLLPLRNPSICTNRKLLTIDRVWCLAHG